MNLLLQLKRLGRKRSPRERLATRYTVSRLGLTQPLVVNSCRKFDKLGEWHMLPMLLRAPFWLLVSRRRVDDYIQSYWYEDR